jgi:hypothetical protein
MNPLHEYRWQDHVVRSGWWKLDLLLAAVSICFIFLAFEAEHGSDRVFASADRSRGTPCEANERSPRAEIVGPVKKGAQPNRDCVQHGDMRWRPSFEIKDAGPNAPSS